MMQQNLAHPPWNWQHIEMHALEYHLSAPDGLLSGRLDWQARLFGPPARQLSAHQVALLGIALPANLHRRDGPALLLHQADGSQLLLFYHDGELHRDNGPAIQLRHPDGSLEAVRYFVAGAELTPLEYSLWQHATQHAPKVQLLAASIKLPGHSNAAPRMALHRSFAAQISTRKQRFLDEFMPTEDIA